VEHDGGLRRVSVDVDDPVDERCRDDDEPVGGVSDGRCRLGDCADDEVADNAPTVLREVRNVLHRCSSSSEERQDGAQYRGDVLTR